MIATAWYLHLAGETKGPFTTSKVLSMLEENLLQFFDFAWKEGLGNWTRLSELPEFASYLPPQPNAPLPSGAKKTENRTAHSTVPSTETETVPKQKLKPKLEVAEPEQKPTPPQPAKPVTPSKYLRIPFDGNITSKQGEYTILNIAERGVFVCSKAPLDAGTEIKFTLNGKAFKKPLEMTGLVVRKSRDDEPSGFVIEFTRINPAHKRVIEEYIRATVEK